jgi:hypothetical protein
VLSREATNTNFIVFGLPDQDSNPRSTALEESMLTITPIFQLKLHNDITNIKDIIHCDYQTDLQAII